jgi:hypothetical protein
MKALIRRAHPQIAVEYPSLRRLKIGAWNRENSDILAHYLDDIWRSFGDLTIWLVRFPTALGFNTAERGEP